MHQGVAMKLLRIAICWLIGVGLMSEPTHAAPADPASVEAALSALAKDERTLKTLAVTYDDLHGLHGGLTLTIHGDGRIEQRAVREKVARPKDRVEPADVKRLVALLVELHAWEQQVPDKRPVPDESRAHLRITLDGHTSSIWERYNDLQKYQRILRIRDLMKKIAWP
jgi:hypothetical protein